MEVGFDLVSKLVLVVFFVGCGKRVFLVVVLFNFVFSTLLIVEIVVCGRVRRWFMVFVEVRVLEEYILIR